MNSISFNMHDWLLTPAQIKELNKTKAGRIQLLEYFTRCRCAIGVQEMIARLNLALTPQQQVECCQVLFECISIHKLPTANVMAWAQEAADALNAERGDGGCLDN